jgi:hypothetical protein
LSIVQHWIFNFGKVGVGNFFALTAFWVGDKNWITFNGCTNCWTGIVIDHSPAIG